MEEFCPKGHPLSKPIPSNVIDQRRRFCHVCMREYSPEPFDAKAEINQLRILVVELTQRVTIIERARCVLNHAADHDDPHSDSARIAWLEMVLKDLHKHVGEVKSRVRAHKCMIQHTDEELAELKHRVWEIEQARKYEARR
jgi:hypothetical protein